MTVQTIPAIDEMTPAQQIELMEALWQSMSERNINGHPPAWHREYLALASGEDVFMILDELEADLHSELGR